MSSKSDATDATGVDESTAERCYRCGEPVSDNRVIRISSEPCPELAGRYRVVTRACCSDCAAGLGMLEFTPEVRTLRPTGSE